MSRKFLGLVALGACALMLSAAANTHAGGYECDDDDYCGCCQVQYSCGGCYAPACGGCYAPACGGCYAPVSHGCGYQAACCAPAPACCAPAPACCAPTVSYGSYHHAGGYEHAAPAAPAGDAPAPPPAEAAPAPGN